MVNAIEDNLNSILKKTVHYARKIHILPKEKPVKILICGNSFVSGEHGIFIKKNQRKKEIVKTIANSINSYTKKNIFKAGKIDIYLLKDFKNDSLNITNQLFNLNYYAFRVEPNMQMQLAESWQNFDDYLNSLKTKFRVKAKKAISRSESLVCEKVTTENVATLIPKMTKLYKKVSQKAGFNLGDFNLESYLDLKKSLQENYVIQVYWLNQELVGFMSGIFNENALDAHFVGIDYTHNRTHAIYQRMLYDYIKIGIKNNVQTINFGRTASEIKSSVGAVPEDLSIYIRHKKSITNKILKLFLLKIQPTEFNQKYPFKSVKNSHENH